MKVLIIGAAGVIGSALTERFLKMGMDMSCLDICRIDEAWRLNNVRDQIKYIWKASNDLLLDDIRGIDVIVDSGIGVADRPLGKSPTQLGNIYKYQLQYIITVKEKSNIPIQCKKNKNQTSSQVCNKRWGCGI